MQPNSTPPCEIRQAAVTAPEFLFKKPNSSWLNDLNRNPAISPTFVMVLGDYAGNSLVTWLNDHAPREIIELYYSRHALEMFYREFELGAGFVSGEANAGILRAVSESINNLDKLGFNEFDAMS